MDRLQEAIAALHAVDTDMGAGRKASRIDPAARLMVCMTFSLVTVSFGKYDLSGLMGMSLFLVVTAIWENISVRRGLYRLRYLAAAVILLGSANLFYDRNIVFYLGNLPVTGGLLSALTLCGKGIFTVFAAYFLLCLIGTEGLCRALRRLGLPGGAVTVLLLTWRYLIVLLKEVRRMWQAYRLRAPGQRGVRMRAWGSFAGLLLLRSMDRAETVYQSMLLRGYDGGALRETTGGTKAAYSLLFVVCWLCVFMILRCIPVFRLAGRIFL